MYEAGDNQYKKFDKDDSKIEGWRVFFVGLQELRDLLRMENIRVAIIHEQLLRWLEAWGEISFLNTHTQELRDMFSPVLGLERPYWEGLVRQSARRALELSSRDRLKQAFADTDSVKALQELWRAFEYVKEEFRLNFSRVTVAMSQDEFELVMSRAALDQVSEQEHKGLTAKFQADVMTTDAIQRQQIAFADETASTSDTLKLILFHRMDLRAKVAGLEMEL